MKGYIYTSEDTIRFHSTSVDHTSLEANHLSSPKNCTRGHSHQEKGRHTTALGRWYQQIKGGHVGSFEYLSGRGSRMMRGAFRLESSVRFPGKNSMPPWTANKQKRKKGKKEEEKEGIERSYGHQTVHIDSIWYEASIKIFVPRGGGVQRFL